MTNLSPKKFRVIADDFAMSEGVNLAILEMCDQNNLDGISVMVTGNFYQQYLEKLRQQQAKNIKIGLHLDFTFGVAKAVNLTNFLVDNSGVFKASFLKIFFLTFFKKKALIRSLYKEIDSQLKTLIKDIGRVDYINGHQHIHFIPLIFKITQKLAKKHQIDDLRIINENFFRSFNFKNPASIASIIKFLVLKFCYLANKTKSNNYFYSILYSCKINQKTLDQFIKKNAKNAEIMIHPGFTEIDLQDTKNREYKHLTSKFRDIERQLKF